LKILLNMSGDPSPLGIGKLIRKTSHKEHEEREEHKEEKEGKDE